MVKFNISDTKNESLLAVKTGPGVFRMEKQSAVNFKVKTKDQLAYSLLSGLGLLSLIFTQFFIEVGKIIPLLSGIIAGIGAILFIYAVRSPVILFTDQGFYFKPALISRCVYYAFDDIQYILPSDSNNTIRFQLEDGQIIHLHLKHLNLKDHIRFVFLLESDVNRKHVLKSIAKYSAP